MLCCFQAGSLSFKRVWEEPNKQALSYTKFIELWKQFHPNDVVAKPMTNLCFTCQKNTAKLLRAANIPEEEKSQCIQAQQQHLTSVQSERELYRKVCEEAKCNFETAEDQIDLTERHEPSSLRTTMHYSFDFAQQVHIPSNRCNRVPSTSRCRVNVLFLVWCVRRSHSR